MNPPLAVEDRSCPDQYVGTLAQLRSDGMIALRAASSTRPDDGAVLLVLESPHISEFRGAPGPAKGNTGKLIAKHALSVRGLEDKGNAPLVLINAIQYQCSLGKATSLYRDSVFLAAWHEFGKADFVARLKATHEANDVVVCACTKGGDGDPAKSLRPLVYAAMLEALPRGAQILRRTHPSSWFAEKNRDYEWAVSDA